MKWNCLYVSLVALLSLSGCNWELPQAQVKPVPPPVTGPFSLYFPDASGVEAAPAAERKPTVTAMPQAFQNKPSVKVGVLLPLSGESGKIGRSMLDAAQLALYDTYVGMPADNVVATVTLLPQDTQASPTIAAAHTKALAAVGAKAIIGPLYSQSAESVGRLSKELHIPVIAFTNNEAAASSGSAIFGPTPQQQTMRLTEFAIAKGLETYALLAPNDAFGNTVTDTFSNAVERKGGKLLYTERYGKNDGARNAAAQRLAEALQQSSVQALMIADTPDGAALMVDAIKAAGVDMANVQLLGSGQWAEEEEAFPGVLEGAWFPSLSVQSYQRFRQRFIAAFGTEPSRLSELAYDATMLIASRIASGKPLDSNGLLGQQMVIGPATGGYRFRPDGVAERAYGVMQITNGQAKTISPAPKLF